MNGTEKQVAWAEDIKAKKIPEFVEFKKSVSEAGFESYKAGKMSEEKYNESKKTFEKLMSDVEGYLATADAKFWIEERESSPRNLMVVVRKIVYGK